VLLDSKLLRHEGPIFAHGYLNSSSQFAHDAFHTLEIQAILETQRYLYCGTPPCPGGGGGGGLFHP